MPEKYAYKMVELDLSTLRMGETEPQAVERLLNFHGPDGWELDRYFDYGDPPSRYFLLRRKSD